MIRTARVVIALILREMSTTYGRSVGGYAWVIIEPAAGIAILTAVFSLLFRSPPLGDNFPIFYATGIVPFTIYNDLSGKIAMSIQFSRQLLVFPAVTFFDALLARFLLNAVTQLLVAYLLFGLILLIYEPRVTLDLPVILTALSMTFALGFGIGVFNCVLFSVFPIYQRIWGIVTRPLMLISTVFYLFEAVPYNLQPILYYNPFVHIIGLMRRGLYPDYAAPFVNPAYVMIIAGVTTVLGLFFLRRYHRKIINEF
ncbi:MAG: ABC transporter permease [Mangrovicoccus sp.]